ncbi:transmembrane protein with metallophosphoesterase domain isoform X1 [Scyliorhinus canicula]|uniref:transmembrane protein with metallophosphoesterase domain isoform X1 n=1 Tax=Scyliorhinus canicula TaxID=7830 RepID=UPI0018F47E8D|nr:transmembrane protein with metallophosphoesterase domain isoform X1 [Scyliorhinus canicula]
MLSLGRLSWEVRVSLAAAAVLGSMAISRSLGDYFAQQTLVKLFRVQFLLFANCLVSIGSRYIWKRTVSSLQTSCPHPCSGSRCFAAWKVTVSIFLLLAHSSFFTLLTLVSEEPHVFSLVSYTCLGMYIFLIFGLLVLGLLEHCHKLVPFGWVAPSHSRNVVKLLLVFLFTIACTVMGLHNARQPPLVKQVEIPVHKLPQSFHNLRMVLLADIHLGPTVGRTKLEMVVKMVNELNPDIIVIVGDLTDSQVVNLRKATEPLRLLTPKLGTYFVTGNHDYYSVDITNWFKHLQTLKIRPLHNEHVKIYSPSENKDWFCLAGVDDIEAEMLRYPGHGMDLKKALDGCSTKDAVVLLAHQPKAAKRALQSRPDISLVLSGHTHAGQIFPLAIVAYFLNPYFEGLYKVGENSLVYVTPGTIFYGIPMRLGSRAEITEIIFKTG